MNLDKLKEAARKFEQREEWRRAIDVYLQAIHEAEEAGEEGTQDPGLYNRVGDLQLKAGDSLAALRAYEEAAQLYADQGFFNNAIALCGKILRVNPSRTGTYLRLAQLHARKNFVGEAKKNLVEYLERMNGVGQLEEAFTALKLFADQFSANPDIRLMLVELLRASSRNEDAKEQLEKVALELEARGDTTAARRTRERLQAIGGATAPSPSNELIFLDTGLVPGVDSGSPQTKNGSPDETILYDDPTLNGSELGLDDPTIRLLDEPESPADPASSDLTDALAAADFAAGDPAGGGGVRGLEEALRKLEAESRWEEALLVASDLVRLEPEVIYRYQKQVELAYYAGERGVLISAYVDLADALVRAGAVHQAAQVYRRVLEHDESHPAARAALALIAPAPGSGGDGSSPPPSAPAKEFVDLGALIVGEQQPRDTRMRVDQKMETEDEDQAFQEALADFKRGIEANLDAEDFQSHYDLGIAFKEMGLMDEAIAEFQKALRSSGGAARLRTSEQLGIAFFDQGQFGVAEAVLRRAVHELPGSDDEKIGLLYWLGRALEARGRAQEALPLYEQALAVDIRFLDVRERARRLASEVHP